MIVEKVLKCCTFYDGWRGIEDLTKYVADELDKGYHIVGIDKQYTISVRTEPLEPDLIITLQKGLK